MRHLPTVQKLDFSLISRKTKEPLEPCTDWLQAAYLTYSAIRQVLSPASSLHDRNHEMIEEFIYKSTMHKTLTDDEDEL